jgi:hypothetical protein
MKEKNYMLNKLGKCQILKLLFRDNAHSTLEIRKSLAIKNLLNWFWSKLLDHENTFFCGTGV